MCVRACAHRLSSSLPLSAKKIAVRPHVHVHVHHVCYDDHPPYMQPSVSSSGVELVITAASPPPPLLLWL